MRSDDGTDGGRLRPHDRRTRLHTLGRELPLHALGRGPRLLCVLGGRLRRAWGRGASRALRTPQVVRSPLWLYHHRLGWLLGRRFLLLEHVGRRTGLPREAVLEVVDRPAPGTYRVVSGLGTRSEWLRNVQHTPRVRVSVGRVTKRPGTAYVHPPEDSAGILSAYAAAHPAAWAALSPVLDDVTARSDTGIPVVDLRLDPG